MISVEWISSLSRILAQPIYRDALLFGKFLAGVATFSIGHEGPWTKSARLVQYLLVLLGRIAEAPSMRKGACAEPAVDWNPLKERNVILDRDDGRDHGT
ncbi:MAG: hypothetical protein WA813_06830, partial [Beijerinckiaceae bacterium]